MKLSTLLEKIPAVYSGDKNAEVSAIVSDSRKLCEGCAFVCIKGGRHDGHEFVKEAIDAGAVAIIA